MLKSGDTPEKNFMVTKIARLNIEKNWSEKKNCRKEKYVEKKKSKTGLALEGRNNQKT